MHHGNILINGQKVFPSVHPHEGDVVTIRWPEPKPLQILPEDINCEGCRVDGIKTVFCERLCPIRQCALKKGVATCGDCPDMETCQTVGMVINSNPDALKNLKG
ncbi:MAG: DUF3795 domain-containing protein [Verrucomicrobia bacterium]|nr:DUF3795 domain-containing protein [Verrucomicrobiota bacterium]